MKKKIKGCRKSGVGYIVEIIEKTFSFWRWDFSRVKSYYVNEFDCVYHPSFLPVLDSCEKKFVESVVEGYRRKKDVRI
jgi:hypothetical protein